MISQYWTDQIPAQPLAIEIRDSLGNLLNMSGYTNFTVELLDEYNNEISLAGSSLNTSQISSGRLIFSWPTDRTLFDDPGEYLLRIKLSKNNAVDYTSTHLIMVKEFGKVRF